MKTNKKNLTTQRQLLDKKLSLWLNLRSDKSPPSGWLKAVRGALGINTRQLSQLLGVEHSTVLRLEERESQGKITLELLDKVAKAMNCKVIYAVVPKEPYQDLESIVDERAKLLAHELVATVEHSMRLEEQGTSDSKKTEERLAYDLKTKMDSRLWNTKLNAKKIKGKSK